LTSNPSPPKAAIPYSICQKCGKMHRWSTASPETIICKTKRGGKICGNTLRNPNG
jgi:hypothetical protein